MRNPTLRKVVVPYNDLRFSCHFESVSLHSLHESLLCLQWACICRYTVPKLLFVPEFHAGTYQYVLFTYLSPFL
jgi:hypothetical protein